MAILAPLVAAVNASHQLTPVMLCMTLMALCLTRRYRNVGLLVVTGIIMIIWDLTMGRVLFLDTLGTLRESAGELMRNSRPGFAGELTGPGPELVGSANILMVLVLGGLAAVPSPAAQAHPRRAAPAAGAARRYRCSPSTTTAAKCCSASTCSGCPARRSSPPPHSSRRRRRYGEGAARRPAGAGAVALPVALVALLARVPALVLRQGGHAVRAPAETALVRTGLRPGAGRRADHGHHRLVPRRLHHYDHYEHWFFTEQEVPENLKMLKDPAGYLERG